MNVKESVNYDRPEELKDRDENVYTCERYMAKGGFSKVYRIKQNRDKLYCGKFVQKDPGKRTNLDLLKEIHIHKGLKHANIVRLCRCVEDRKFYCLILEYCDNKSMSELIKRRKGLCDSEIRYYSRQILSGMKYLHCNNVIHRDIKPQNILINSNMILKIADFGLAAKIGRKYCKIKKSTIYGTPNYMSPEMINPNVTEYDYKVDIWAIGVLLYDMVAGHPPFLGSSIDLIYQNILRCNYALPPTMSRTLGLLIKRILVASPDKRPEFDSISRDSFFIVGFTPKMMPDSALVEAPRFLTRTVARKYQSNLAAMLVKPGSAIRKFSSLSIKKGVNGKSSALKELPIKKPSYCNKNCVRYMLRHVKADYCDMTGSQNMLSKWNESELETPFLEPVIWVSSFTRYQELCGAYVLNNGIVGGMYKNRTSLTILPDNNVQYYAPSSSSKYIWKLSDCPSTVRKNADLLKSIYRKEILKIRNTNVCGGGEFICVMPHVMYYEYKEDTVIMVLSTGLFQVNDRKTDCKCLLCPKLKAFTVIDKENQSTTFGLNAMKKYGHPTQLHDPLIMAFQHLRSFLNSDICLLCNKNVFRKKV